MGPIPVDKPPLVFDVKNDEIIKNLKEMKNRLMNDNTKIISFSIFK